MWAVILPNPQNNRHIHVWSIDLWNVHTNKMVIPTMLKAMIFVVETIDRI